MKAVLPILICSAISAGLGYYFGHITVPADLKGPAPVATSDKGNTTTPAPQPEIAEVEDTFEPAPEPVEAAPEPEDTPPETATEPEATESSFAERANSTTQTLTDTQGRTIQASIVKVLDTEVKIRRTDGLETTIPLNMLSEEDVAFCNYLRDQQKEEEEVKAPDTSDGFDWDAYFNS